MNQYELIDLHRSNTEFEQVVEQIQQQLRQPKILFANTLRIQFQFQGFIPPQIYILQITSIQIQCKLLQQANQININEDFYLSPAEFCQVFIKFIAFLYCGKLKYSLMEYLIYIKLSMYFECQELFVELSFKINQQGLDRSFFLPVFIYLKNHPMFSSLEEQHRNHFIRELILANTQYFTNFKKWNPERIQKVKQAFAAISPSIFEDFAVNLKGNEKFEELTQFLFEINEIKNPNMSTLEMIYIEKIVDIVDEPFLDKFAHILTKNVKNIFQKIVHKDNQIVYHFIQSKICNMHKMYFMSSCGHMTCLNCFLEYFLYKVTSQLQIGGYGQKKCQIKCISRYLDNSICKQDYIHEDYKKLENFVPNELLQIYLQK